MIINEKYLQDIDDEDDDVISSNNEFNDRNKKDLDYEFTVELYNDRMLIQHSRSYLQRNNLKFCTLGDFVDYYE